MDINQLNEYILTVLVGEKHRLEGIINEMSFKEKSDGERQQFESWLRQCNQAIPYMLGLLTGMKLNK